MMATTIPPLGSCIQRKGEERLLQPFDGPDFAIYSGNDLYRYRYVLRRVLPEKVPATTIVFLMLNPSTADEMANDPTVERCCRRAEELGHSELIVLNLFALRSADPNALDYADDPVGPDNDRFLQWYLDRADCVVAGWGAHGGLMGRNVQVLDMMRRLHVQPECLGKTKEGHPRHPLYVPYSQPLVAL